MLSKFIIFLPGDGRSLPSDFQREGSVRTFGPENPVYFVVSPSSIVAAPEARIALIWDPEKSTEISPTASQKIEQFLQSADLCAVAYHHDLGSGACDDLRKVIAHALANKRVMEYRYHHDHLRDRSYPYFSGAALARSSDQFASCLDKLAIALQPQIYDAGIKLLLRLLPKYLDSEIEVSPANCEANLEYMRDAVLCQLEERQAEQVIENIFCHFNACLEATTEQLIQTHYNHLARIVSEHRATTP